MNVERILEEPAYGFRTPDGGAKIAAQTFWMGGSYLLGGWAFLWAWVAAVYGTPLTLKTFNYFGQPSL